MIARTLNIVIALVAFYLFREFLADSTVQLMITDVTSRLETAVASL